MPLKKIVSIKNIGRFRNLSAVGDVHFKDLTLVYGPNGYGKTTLAGVLRSLLTGDRAYIDERATLGQAAGPEATILLQSGSATFANGRWSATAPDLEIFDSTFVNDNVFTGEHVGPEHRKNLYEVVVGSSAVSLAKEIDSLDVEGRRAAGEITSAEGELGELIHKPFSLDDFVGLEIEPELPEKISDCTTRLSAVRKSTEILGRPQLDQLMVPEVPADFFAVLGRSVAQITVETEERVRAHFRRLDQEGEAWVRQGLRYMKPDRSCPFCGQDTSTAALVHLYGEFFSTVYGEHVIEIERARNRLEQAFGDEALGAFQKRSLENSGRIQRWADLSDLSFAIFGADRLEQAWKHLRSLLRDRFRRKSADPSHPIPDDAVLSAAVADYTAARDALAAHNQLVLKANALIAELKRKAAATDPESLEQELRRLRNIQVRQGPEAMVLIEKLMAARRRKKDLEQAKENKKTELETLAGKILETYQASINRLLLAFGANFSIVNARPSFPGGKASSTYQLEINSTALDIGDSRTPRGKPCFRTVLSTGDKSTLALAFFLARLEPQDLRDRTVVIDDPVSSLDSFRRASTQERIASITGRAAQTIVMSHDAFFLRGLLATADHSKSICLQVVRDSGSYTVRPWDVDTYFLREAHQEYFLLKSYIIDGPPENEDLTSVARAIRPYLEGSLRNRFPDQFGPREWLGDFLSKIRQAPPTSPLSALQPKLTEFEAINEYSKGFHHSPPPRPDDTELQAWVKRTFDVVQAG